MNIPQSPAASCVADDASPAASALANQQTERLLRASRLSTQCTKWTLLVFAGQVGAFWLWASLPPEKNGLILGGLLTLSALWFIWELGRASRWWLKLLELQSLQAKLDALETLRQTAADIIKARQGVIVTRPRPVGRKPIQHSGKR